MAQDVTELTLTLEQPERRSRLDVVPPAFVPALAVVVTGVALIVRIGLLGNQSYWGDELFSVGQAAGDLRHVFAVGGREIHTPLYATLLWVWERLGTSTVWTHSLSGLFGLAAIVATYVCLRATPLSDTARSIAVAVTAANGFGIVYSQESRPYALVLLGATGLTAVTAGQLVARPNRPVPAGLTWLVWALLTATAHLLGLFLVGTMAVLLVIKPVRERAHRLVLTQLGLAALAAVPQLAWILAGLSRKGFAGGTTWITAPDFHDLWALLTTVFSSGGLVPRADGFDWTSGVGLAVVTVLLLIAFVLERRQRLGGWDADARAGLALVLVAAATLLLTMAVSFWIHVWTLRNMIVVMPALTWGAAWMIVGLPRREPVRRVMGAAILIALLVSLPALSTSLEQPYKTDWRSLVVYLEHERAVQSEATFSFFGSGPKGAFVAADHGPKPASLQHIYDRVDMHPRPASAIAQLRRLAGPQVVVFYAGVWQPRPVEIERAIKERLADPSCRSLPIYGLVVVACGT
jgi:hypothetical protein